MTAGAQVPRLGALAQERCWEGGGGGSKADSEAILKYLAKPHAGLKDATQISQYQGFHQLLGPSGAYLQPPCSFPVYNPNHGVLLPPRNSALPGGKAGPTRKQDP